VSTTYAKGRYQARVTDQGFEEAGTGTPCFYLQLQILGQYAADGKVQECPRYERTYRQYLKNDIGAAILKADLRSLGVEVSDLQQLDLAASNPITLVERTIEVACDHAPYNGTLRERWSIPRVRKKLDLSAVRELNDQFGHVLRGGNGTARPAGAPPAPNDTDTPF
jgi:hypothetical protein